MIVSPSVDDIVTAARARMGNVRDRDLVEAAVRAIKDEFFAWKRNENNFIRGLPRGFRPNQPEVIRQIAEIRADFYNKCEYRVQQAISKQQERQQQKSRDLDSALKSRASQNRADKDRDKGGRSR